MILEGTFNIEQEDIWVEEYQIGHVMTPYQISLVYPIEDQTRVCPKLPLPALRSQSNHVALVVSLQFPLPEGHHQQRCSNQPE